MELKPMSESIPNIITAVGNGWTVFVGQEELTEGESVIMSVDERIITNASLAGYNFVTDRVCLKGERFWHTIDELERFLSPGQYIRRINGPVEVSCVYNGDVVNQEALVSLWLWGERIIVKGAVIPH